MEVVLTSLSMKQLVGDVVIVTGSFVVLLILIRIFVWDNITGILAKRAEKIAHDIDNVEKANKEAQSLVLKRKEELDSVCKIADQMLIEAKKTGESIKSRAVVAAKNEILLMKNKAQEDISRKKTETLESMKEEVYSLSLEIAQKILMRELDHTGHSQLIDRYLDRLGE